MAFQIIVLLTLILNAVADHGNSELRPDENLDEALNILQAALGTMYITPDFLLQEESDKANNDIDFFYSIVNSKMKLLKYMNISNIENLESSSIVHNNTTKNSSCLDNLGETFAAFKRNNISTEWLIAMIDSNGKIPSGILRGATNWPGNYDECTSISVKYFAEGNYSYGGFRGQYCSSTFFLELSTLSINITNGLCIPNTCSSNEVFHFFRHIFSYLKNSSVKITPLTFSCYPVTESLSSGAIGYLVLLSILLLFILLGSALTAYEYLFSKTIPQHNNSVPETIYQIQEDVSEKNKINIHGNMNEETQHNQNINPEYAAKNAPCEVYIVENTRSRFTNIIVDFLKCFCVFTNGKKILNTDSIVGQMDCLHGIRVISMTWVILGHSYFFAASYVSNILYAVSLMQSWSFQAVNHALFSVDSFFFLSGFLVTFLFLKEAKRTNGKINWLLYYVHRFWRLTPPYMLVLGFYGSLSKYLGHGPYRSFPSVITDSSVCETNWWRNLLYIDNFFESNRMCMGWSWYLDNDMQFYVISPIFLYALWKKEIFGLIVMLLLLLGGWISTAVVTAEQNLSPLLSGIHDNINIKEFTELQNRVFESIYIKPYCRIAPYLVGSFIGYILYKTGDHKRFLKMWQQVLGWTVAAYLCISVVYGLCNVDITTVLSVFYNSFSRTAWGIGLGWVVYTCLIGHGGFINTLLSWKLWIPLSRLTYCAYLVHPIIMKWYYSSVQAPIYLTNFTMVTSFLGFVIYAYIAAFATSLVCEAPMMALEKRFFNLKR